MEQLKNFMQTKGKYQYQQVFGIKEKQFSKLFDVFKIVYLKEINIQYIDRQAKYSDYGMIARKKIIGDKKLNWYLHIVLYYLRQYPTYEVLGWQIGKFKQDAFKIIQNWFPLLMKSLKMCKVVPIRDLEHLEEITRHLLGEGILQKEDLDLIIDVTERRINRPLDYDTQKTYYSGKKKCHTIKNTILSTVCLVVLFLGKTHKGTKHDFSMFKVDCPKKKWYNIAVFEPISIWVDLGYLGIKKWCTVLQNLYIPYKKPRTLKGELPKELSKEQKAYNTFVSRTRIRGEHVIGHIKNTKIVSHKFRGRKENWNDDVMLAATALHIFKVIFL